MTAYASLIQRLAELSDLSSLSMLAEWDQHVLMPAAGGESRAHLMSTLGRIAHERATSDEVGAWLEELEGAELDAAQADIVRLARRDWTRARQVPTDLAADLVRAGSEGQEAWVAARAADDFAAFAPYLKTNLELARAHAACFDGYAEPYDALLADFDFGLTAATIERVFGALTDGLPALIAQARRRPAPPKLELPVAAQEQAARTILAQLGAGEDSWRLDVSPHPFTVWVGSDDVRITTRYTDPGAESLLATLHEYGHGLYEHQIPRELARTSAGTGTSMSVHESQSKLWENHVGRHPRFADVLAQALGVVSGPDLHAVVAAVGDTPIRVAADELSYPLHIVLRFELERALVAGTLEVDDLPAAFNDRIRELLGIEIRDNATGVMQDIHWAGGAFGYFPSYALGVLIAAQLWETLEDDLGSQDEALARCEVAPIREWLADRVHRHGRRLDTTELVVSATGRELDPAAFLRRAEVLAGV